MNRIDLDVDMMPDGKTPAAVYFIDADDPVTLAVLTRIKGNPAQQTLEGWNKVSKHPNALPGETIYAFLKRQVSAPSGPATLKVLNLT